MGGQRQKLKGEDIYTSDGRKEDGEEGEEYVT